MSQFEVIEALYLGGSVARGDFVPGKSDIDLYAVFKDPSEDTEKLFEQEIKQIESRHLQGVYGFNPNPISLAFTTIEEIREGRSFLGSGFEHYNFIRDGKLLFGSDIKELIPKPTREQEILEANHYLKSVEQSYRNIPPQNIATLFSYIFRTLCVSLSSKGLYVSSKKKAVDSLIEQFPGEKTLIEYISKVYELYLKWGSHDLTQEEVEVLEDIYTKTMPLLIKYGIKEDCTQ